MHGSTIKEQRAGYIYSLEVALDQIVHRLSEMPKVERVILFGSYAAGRRDLFTDLDLIVVIETNLDYINRSVWLYQMLQTDVDLDMIIYTPDEFQQLQDSNFLKHVLKTAKVVYERPSN